MKLLVVITLASVPVRYLEILNIYNPSSIRRVGKSNFRNMRRNWILFLVFLAFASCAESELEAYTGRELTYKLQKSSEYEFSGSLRIRELVDQSLEWVIVLEGPKSSSPYSYPAHLHFGSYDQPHSAIASMLTPVSSQTLKSITKISQLSDGTTLDFDAMQTFNGHVKVHLAAEGPDYQVILVAGNVGGNPTAIVPEKVAICDNTF